GECNAEAATVRDNWMPAFTSSRNAVRPDISSLIQITARIFFIQQLLQRDKPVSKHQALKGPDHMIYQDKLLRFSFDQLDIRGELVYLDQTWESVLSRHDYPPVVQRQLGTALAAVALLSLSIKYEGTMILQIQGKGPLRSLVTQITHNGSLRGLARWEGPVPDGSLQDIFGDGQMLISVMKEGGDRYQSIVSLDGDSLCEALNSYFQQSEQLPSNFQLFVNADRVCGLFLEALPRSSRGKRRIADDLHVPAERDHDENWNRITTLAS